MASPLALNDTSNTSGSVPSALRCGHEQKKLEQTEVLDSTKKGLQEAIASGERLQEGLQFSMQAACRAAVARGAGVKHSIDTTWKTCL
jgi:hypothetical protein